MRRSCYCGEVTAEKTFKELERSVDALKSRIVLEQERRDRADTSVREMNENNTVLKTTIEEQKAETKECVTEMTTSYNQMKDLLDK